MPAIRPAAVAGTFYPGDPAALSAASPHTSGQAPRGRDARPRRSSRRTRATSTRARSPARVYARLAPLRGTVRRVVLAGPAHRVYVRGRRGARGARVRHAAGPRPARPRGDRRAARAAVRRGERPRARARAFARGAPAVPAAVLGDFALVPLVVGDASPREMAQLLDTLWGGAETLIVVSSDLSHYLPYDAARARDRAHRRARSSRLDATLDPEEACGATPINGLLRAARARAASRPSWSTCATPATPRAIATASSATARSRSREPRHG